MGEAFGVLALAGLLVAVFLLGKWRQRESTRQQDDDYRQEVEADQDDLAGVSADTWRQRLRAMAKRRPGGGK